MVEERHTCTNLPAQIEIEASDGYSFDLLFIARAATSSPSISRAAIDLPAFPSMTHHAASV
jgi:hypothetical protein